MAGATRCRRAPAFVTPAGRWKRPAGGPWPLRHGGLVPPRRPFDRHIWGSGRRRCPPAYDRAVADGSFRPGGAASRSSSSGRGSSTRAGPGGPGAPPAGPGARRRAAGRTRKAAREAVAGSPVHDVLVVGGGPAGSSCAYWLAEAGWDVALVEKKRFPREKTCGDGLTPRSVRQLADMGLEDSLAGAHRFSGLRAHGFGRVLDLPWPEHPSFPSYGYIITRHDLDGIVNERAAKAGRHRLAGHRGGVAPIADDGPAAGGTPPGLALPRGGAVVDRARPAGTTREVRARYVVVADGANSRFGRALGIRPRPRPPDGDGPARLLPVAPPRRPVDRVAPRHPRRRRERWCPATGGSSRWATGGSTSGSACSPPTGGGRGSTPPPDGQLRERGPPPSWELSPETSCGPPTGGKLPMGLAVGPRAGANAAGGRRRRRLPSTPSTARASPTATRPGAWPPPRSARRCRASGVGGPGRVRPAPPGRLRPLLPGGPGLRPDDQPPRGACGCASGSACTRSSSCPSSCASWPTSCAPTTVGAAEAGYRAMAAIARLLPPD